MSGAGAAGGLGLEVGGWRWGAAGEGLQVRALLGLPPAISPSLPR